jgi:hypothetical protein
MTLRWLAAWKRLRILGESRLIQSGMSKTSFTADEVAEFLRQVEACGARPPQGWKQLLNSGHYTKNDYFDVFAEGIVPPNTNGIAAKRGPSGVIIAKLAGKQQRFTLPRDIVHYEVVGGLAVSDSALILLQDPKEAWAFYCAKFTSRNPDWLMRIDTYWVFPEGANSTIELVVSEDRDKLFVFCAMPVSLSIDCLDLRSGNRIAAFSSQLADLSGFVVAHPTVGESMAEGSH